MIRSIFKLIGLLIALVVLAFLFVGYFLPLPQDLKNPATSTTKIFDRNGILLYELLAPHQGRASFAKLENISPRVLKATLAAEDARFYQNSGVEWKSIVRALIQNVKEQKVISGASTITQQLVRNTISTGELRGVKQKIKESAYAIRITQKFSKDAILEMYLSRVYYGNHNYGISAAAQGYFDKNPSELDLAEASFLAGLPQAPSSYDPFEHYDIAKKRQERVLNLMVKHEFIKPEEAQATLEEELKLNKKSSHPIKAPHFVNFVVAQLKEKFPDDLYNGLEVHTTLDSALQSKVEELAKQHVKNLEKDDVSNAAALVMSPISGQIYVMMGSVDFFDKKIDGEVNSVIAKRQPGSTLKPFTYALAFENGWNLATQIEDAPVRYFTAGRTPYLPKNFDFQYHGIVTPRTALANSYNIPAIKTLEFVGVDTLLERLRAAGLETLTNSPEHYGLALTLGDGEVRLLDLVKAYSAFAREGENIEPVVLKRVTKNGKTLFESEEPKTKRIFSKEIAFLITNILSDNQARIEEFGLKNKLELNRPAAAKTGTTRNFKDAWTIGYTSDRIVGVWVGNNDGKPMNSISGGSGASPLWHDMMVAAHRNIPPHEFLVPDGVEKLSISNNNTEWFIKNEHFDVQNEQEEKIKILNPFDGDEFFLSSLVRGEAQKLLLKAEVQSSESVIIWLVNGKQIGQGKKIWWNPKKGIFEIRAQLEDDKSINKTVTITIH